MGRVKKSQSRVGGSSWISSSDVGGRYTYSTVVYTYRYL